MQANINKEPILAEITLSRVTGHNLAIFPLVSLPHRMEEHDFATEADRQRHIGVCTSDRVASATIENTILKHEMLLQGRVHDAHEQYRQQGLDEDASHLRDIIAVATAESGYDFTGLL